MKSIGVRIIVKAQKFRLSNKVMMQNEKRHETAVAFRAKNRLAQ